jgi:hypothetical protein
VLTKNSGTNYDSSWATLIPGDRYLTTSTTSLTIDNANKTFTVATGLSYSSQQDIVISYDASNHMHARVIAYNPSTGQLDVDVLSHTGSGTYAAWVINVGGTPALASVVWGDILGTLGNQGDLATALSNKLETSTAASTYYPLSGNPSGFLVAADITGKADLASPALTGNVTITTNSASPALVITQDGAGDIIQFKDVTSDTTYSFIDASGKVGTIASTTANAGFNIAHGAAPTTPVNGDIWTTTSGVFARINAGTQQLMSLGNTQTVSGSITFANASQTLGNSTAASTINIGTGATLTATTKAVNIGTNGVSGSTTNITVGPVAGASTTSIGNTTAASTLNLATGATLSALTKAVNIGTNGVSGSSTLITIGSTTGSSAITLQNQVITTGSVLSLGQNTTGGSYNFGSGVTSTGNTKTVSLGTNGEAGSTTNITIGGFSGTSTTKLQGTTNGVTLAADTNSVALATTAFVVGQAGSATPLVNGTAAVGTSLRYARQDHVHGTDTTRAAVDSQVFTGTPTLPTGTIATTQSPGDNTTALATTAFVTAAVPAFATSAQSRQGTSSTTAQNPLGDLWQMMNPGFIPINRGYLNYTATGTMGAAQISGFTSRMTMGTAGAASGSFRTFGSSQVDQAWICVSKGYRSYIDFSRVTWCSGRFYTEDTWTDPQVSAGFYFGKANNSANGDLARKGFGWRIYGNATAGSRTAILQVHNGTTLTNVSTTFALVAQQYFDWDVVSLGNGTVTLYINGTQVATTALGPTGDTSYSGTAPVIWNEEFVSTGTTAGSNATFSRGLLYIAP